MNQTIAKFCVGQLVSHKLFDYRGVIVDVGPFFKGTEQWHQGVVKSKPPRDQPCYHVLVDGQNINTYVAERNLEADNENKPINRYEIGLHFERLGDTGYISIHKDN